MENGFTDANGFSNVPASRVGASAGASASRAAARGAAGAALSAEERSAQRLNASSGWFNMGYMADLIPLPFIGAGMAVAATGLKRVGAVVKMGQVPFRALSRTSIGEFHQVRAVGLDSARRATKVTGGKADAWTPTIERAMNTASRDDLARAGKAREFVRPLTSRIGQMLERDNKINNFAKRHLGKFTNWRAAAMAKKSDTALQEMVQAAGELGNKSKMPIIGKERAALKGFASQLSSRIQGAEHLTGYARSSHLANVGEEIEQLISRHKLVDGEARAMYGLKDKILGAAHTASVHGSHMEAASGGLKSLVKGIGRMGGRLTLVQGLVAVGATLAVAAVMKTHGHENHLAREAINDMAADIGDPNAELVQDAKAAFGKQKLGRMASTGLTAGAQAANVSMANMFSNAGSDLASQVPVMIFSGMGEKLGQSLIPGNPILNSYANLKKAEREHAPMNKAERTEHVRQLVGAVRSVRAHGGYYNHLARDVATEIVSRDLKLPETLKLLSDKSAFTALAAEVKAKHAKDKPAHTGDKHLPAPHDHNDKGEMVRHSEGNPVHHHLGGSTDTSPRVDSVGMIGTAKPGNIVAADRVLEGRVTDAQRAVGA